MAFLWLKRLFVAIKIVFAVEFLHASGGIHYLLLAGVIRVANVADINLQFALCGARLEGVSTGATHCHRLVFGVNSLFHLSISLG